ncbi:DUF1441 family protein [Spartinivicinus ruber]|uniref:DUF1441 family protein n=1 Tax=Spartinivicinus ruber TaxID=2683272 RepID=UPI0013D3275C|nr:DUF1441 family protein [Spartinivicinus ruber]
MPDNTGLPANFNWSISLIADAFGLSRQTVRKRIRQAGIEPAGTVKSNPVYALADVGPILFTDNLIESADFTPEKLPPKERKDWYQSETERHKLAVQVRELIPEGEVRDEMATLFKSLVSYFESLPDKVERTRLFTTEQLSLLDDCHDKFREELYQQLMAIDDD